MEKQKKLSGVKDEDVKKSQGNRKNNGYKPQKPHQRNNQRR